MKRTIRHLLSLFLLFSLTASSYGQFGIRGNGNVIRETRQVSSFTSIDTKAGWDVILIQGNDHSVIVETDENLMDKVITEVRGGELHIFSEGKIMKRTESNVYVTFVNIEELYASSGSDITAETIIKGEKLMLDLSSGSDIDHVEFDLRTLIGDFSSGSDANLTFASIQHIRH